MEQYNFSPHEFIFAIAVINIHHLYNVEGLQFYNNIDWNDVLILVLPINVVMI